MAGQQETGRGQGDRARNEPSGGQQGQRGGQGDQQRPQGGNPQNPGTGNLPQGDQREREQENPVRRPGEREGDRPAPRPDTDPNRRMPQYTDPPAKPEVQSEAE